VLLLRMTLLQLFCLLLVALLNLLHLFRGSVLFYQVLALFVLLLLQSLASLILRVGELGARAKNGQAKVLNAGRTPLDRASTFAPSCVSRRVSNWTAVLTARCVPALSCAPQRHGLPGNNKECARRSLGISHKYRLAG
jgi:hypothetical protein